jgi:hypothetical protein
MNSISTSERVVPSGGLTFGVTDFGPIAKADVDLRPLTVFIGPATPASRISRSWSMCCTAVSATSWRHGIRSRYRLGRPTTGSGQARSRHRCTSSWTRGFGTALPRRGRRRFQPRSRSRFARCWSGPRDFTERLLSPSRPYRCHAQPPSRREYVGPARYDYRTAFLRRADVRRARRFPRSTDRHGRALCSRKRRPFGCCPYWYTVGGCTATNPLSCAEPESGCSIERVAW